MRKLISTGSPWEAKAGYSRAVVADDTIYIVEAEATAVRARP